MQETCIDAESGMLEAGKYADIVAVPCDVLADIRNSTVAHRTDGLASSVDRMTTFAQRP